MEPGLRSRVSTMRTAARESRAVQAAVACAPGADCAAGAFGSAWTTGTAWAPSHASADAKAKPDASAKRRMLRVQGPRVTHWAHPSHALSVPLVEGMPCTRREGEMAIDKARAKAL